MDVTKMTRMQGERAVAATKDLGALKTLGDHKNKHVRAKAAYKFAAVSNELRVQSIEAS